MGLISCLDAQAYDHGQECAASGADAHPLPVKLPHVTSAKERPDPPHKAIRRQRRIQTVCAVALREDTPTVPRWPRADNPMNDRTGGRRPRRRETSYLPWPTLPDLPHAFREARISEVADNVKNAPALRGSHVCNQQVAKRPFFPRPLKKVQMQGGMPQPE